MLIAFLLQSGDFAKRNTKIGFMASFMWFLWYCLSTWLSYVGNLFYLGDFANNNEAAAWVKSELKTEVKLKKK